MKDSSRRPRLSVTTGGRNVVAHAGARLLVDLADDLGLTNGLSAAMAPTKKRRRGHDRGAVLVDLAVSLADGGRRISDLRSLIDQPSLFGEVASVSTAWRTLSAVDDATLGLIASARSKARAKAWAAGMDPGFYVIDIDGTLVTAHSDKELAAPNYKHSFGFYPLMSYLDATGEPLAGLLRPGNAGSGTAVDYVTVLDASLLQLPVDPNETEVICRSDSAGCSHAFLEACRERNVVFVVGHPFTEVVANAVVSELRSRWVRAIDAGGTEEADWAEVAEVTDLLDLSAWPEGTRAIARREVAHPGAQLTFTDVEGRRYQLFLTDHESDDVAFLEGLYRGRGRAECSIRDAKDTGLDHLPSFSFALNSAWLAVVLLAGDLLAFAKNLLVSGAFKKAEPRRLRYCLFHTAGVIVSSGRRRTMRIAQGWPWADELVAAFSRLPRFST